MSVGSAADMALAYSGAIYSPLQASSGQYPGIQSTIVPPVISTGTNGSGGSGGWESLLQQQQVMPLAASGMAKQGASTTAASSATAAAGQSAMYAWQQYQVENQRKLALQQQLDQQQRIQQQLQQQLTVQKHQYWPLQATLDSAAAMSALQNLNSMPPPLQNMFVQGDESRQGALSKMYSTYMQRPSTVAVTAFGAAASESASASASAVAALQGAVLSNTSHYLPMQFTTAASATATTSMSGGPAIGNRTGHNVGLPSVYGSYGNYGN
ncbi:hypothetical protein GGF37_002124 [Kickxella alabastrina]|nr:hypothetical protein GGF37_002124 [Kickxella alabastrina]